MPPLLDPTFDWKRLAELMKELGPEAFEDRIRQALRSSALSIFAEILTDLTLDAETKLAYRLAMSAAIQTKTATKTSIKCILKGTSRNCPGCGGRKWQGGAWRGLMRSISDFQDRVESTSFEALKYRANLRPVAKAYIKRLEKVLDDVEAIIVAASIDAPDESEYDREYYWGFVAPCLQKMRQFAVEFPKQPGL